MEGDAGAQARVLFQKLLHLVRVARKDHHGVVPLVLHLLDDGVDGLISKEPVLVIHKGVGLVDEQDRTLGCCKFCLYRGSGPAYILAHQISAAHLNQISHRQQTILFHDLGEQPGHSGFGSAGVAGEHHVHGGPLQGDALLPEQLLGLVVVQRLGDDRFCFGQANHFFQFVVGAALGLGFLNKFVGGGFGRVLGVDLSL